MKNRRAIPLIVYLVLLVVVFSWANELFSDSVNQLPYSTVVDLFQNIFLIMKSGEVLLLNLLLLLINL